MTPEAKLGFALLALFGAGLVLVAVGLGLSTRSAAFAVGLITCFATAYWLGNGPRCRR